jgi:hypothetical protein
MIKKYYHEFPYKDLLIWTHLLKEKIEKSNPFLKGLYDIIFTNKKNTLVVE